MAKKENTLAGWSKVIEDSAKQAQEKRVKWQEQIGEPDEIYEVDDYKLGEKKQINKFGLWKIPDGVLVVRFDKRGPNPATQQIFTTEFIEKLVKTLEK